MNGKEIMMRREVKCGKILAGLACSLVLVLTSAAEAVIQFDQNVTNEVIFGSGNVNGSFTTDRANGIELGLRGKLRFNANNLPENTFNSNGDGSYTFDAGVAPGGFSFAPNSDTTPVWSFEWSINSNFDGTSGLDLDDLTYEIGIDFDPGAGTNYLVFDPINQTIADHAIGNNGTGNGAGVTANDATEYANLIASNNLAQNSWNMEFFNDSPFETFDPTVPGTYSFYLTAFDGSGQVAHTEMIIDVVPEPSAILLGLISGALAGLLCIRRRARNWLI